MWCNENAAPTFALIYVEHAGFSSGGETHWTLGKAKAPESSRRQPSSAPSFTRNRRNRSAPLGTLHRRGYFRPPRCPLSLPLRCARYSTDFLAIAGKSHPRRFRKSRLCKLSRVRRDRNTVVDRAQFIFSEGVAEIFKNLLFLSFLFISNEMSE